MSALVYACHAPRPLLTLCGSPACGVSESVRCSAIEVELELEVVEWSGVVTWGMVWWSCHDGRIGGFCTGRLGGREGLPFGSEL